jgi:hypothetical protein
VKWTTEGWKRGSSSTAPASQARRPEFTPKTILYPKKEGALEVIVGEGGGAWTWHRRTDMGRIHNWELDKPKAEKKHGWLVD